MLINRQALKAIAHAIEHLEEGNVQLAIGLLKRTLAEELKKKRNDDTKHT